MRQNFEAWRRGLLAVLLFLNLFAPIQKVLACVALLDQAMPMNMACCPEAVSMGDARHADIERGILNGDSCCTIELKATAQTPSSQHHQYAEAAHKQVSDVQWQHVPPLPVVLPLADSGIAAAPPPNEPLAELAGSATYASTARLRI